MLRRPRLGGGEGATAQRHRISLRELRRRFPTARKDPREWSASYRRRVESAVLRDPTRTLSQARGAHRGERSYRDAVRQAPIRVQVTDNAAAGGSATAQHYVNDQGDAMVRIEIRDADDRLVASRDIGASDYDRLVRDLTDEGFEPPETTPKGG